VACHAGWRAGAAVRLVVGRRSGREEALLLEERYQGLQDRWDALQDEKMLAQQKLDQQQTLLLKLTARLKEAEATLRSERIASAEKLQLQQEAEQRLSQQFENLANRILNKMPATSAN
jgi:DNA recombination protein RmuC